MLIQEDKVDGGSHGQGGSQTVREKSVVSSLDSDIERIWDRKKKRL